ncbi:MAG: HAD family phosphatase [Chloroflexota bacterium]|nr:HAD family phosphatase [Chloroflexota bacterium]
MPPLTPHQPPARAVIFDMDGVLVDGEPLHFAAARDVLAGFGAELTWETYTHWIGETFDTIWPDIQRRFALPVDRGEYERAFGPRVQEQYERHAVAMPGAHDLLGRLRDAGVPLGLATSTERPRVDIALARLDLARFLTVTVSGDEVSRGKPDPEIYLTAAARLDVPPARCLVLEDSPAGVASARAAGMRAIGVRINGGSGRPLDGADRIIESLADFDLGWVETPQREGAQAHA